MIQKSSLELIAHTERTRFKVNDMCVHEAIMDRSDGEHNICEFAEVSRDAVSLIGFGSWHPHSATTRCSVAQPRTSMLADRDVNRHARRLGHGVHGLPQDADCETRITVVREHHDSHQSRRSDCRETVHMQPEVIRCNLSAANSEWWKYVNWTLTAEFTWARGHAGRSAESARVNTLSTSQ
jgi:hypothetical protein